MLSHLLFLCSVPHSWAGLGSVPRSALPHTQPAAASAVRAVRPRAAHHCKESRAHQS